MSALTVLKSIFTTPKQSYNRHNSKDDTLRTRCASAIQYSRMQAVQQDTSHSTSQIAGLTSELAQQRQALLVLAQAVKESTASTVTSLDCIENSIHTVVQQTRTKVRPFVEISKEMHKLWRDIIDDGTFLNDMYLSLKAGRVARTLMSFGTAGPESIKAAKREVYSHIKEVRTKRERIETLMEYATAHHPNDLKSWVEQRSETITAGDESWTYSDFFGITFLRDYQRQLYAMRNV